MRGMFPGFPGGRWNRKRHWGGPFFGGGGWVFPAMIIGRLLQEALEQSSRGGWPQPETPPPPARPSAPEAPRPTPAAASTTAWSESIVGQTGRPASQSAPRRECRYCGRDLPGDVRQCLGCGAPTFRA